MVNFHSRFAILLFSLGMVPIPPGIVIIHIQSVLAADAEYKPIVEAEDIVTKYTAAKNGAGPLWCYGSTVITRQGDEVYVSIIETGKDVPLLCNTRWQLWSRSSKEGWKIIQTEDRYRQREPCPIAGFYDGTVFLSVNPSTEPPGVRYGPCKPLVLAFNRLPVNPSYRTLEPSWAEGTYFTDHSYRGLAADGEKGELLLLHINARTGAQYVSYRDNQGKWQPKGKIQFPIRSCYPQVAQRDHTAHVLAIGDIVEPKKEWQTLKYEKLKRKWDYVFRRLFYTYTPDIQSAPFQAPMEIDSVENTAGHITNLDLYIDAEGTAHVLYLKRPHQFTFIRDTYFPGQPMTVYLEYMRIAQGKIVLQTSLTETPGKNAEGIEPSYGRLHVDSLNNLYVIVAGTYHKNQGKSVFGNYIGEITDGGDVSNFKMIPLEHPFRNFMTNTTRGGSKPSDSIDLFGIADDNPNLRYARIRLTKTRKKLTTRID